LLFFLVFQCILSHFFVEPLFFTVTPTRPQWQQNAFDYLILRTTCCVGVFYFGDYREIKKIAFSWNYKQSKPTKDMPGSWQASFFPIFSLCVAIKIPGIAWEPQRHIDGIFQPWNKCIELVPKKSSSLCSCQCRHIIFQVIVGGLQFKEQISYLCVWRLAFKILIQLLCLKFTKKEIQRKSCSVKWHFKFFFYQALCHVIERELRYKEKTMDPEPGFWGVPTSTLDWCETNYEVSFVKGC